MIETIIISFVLAVGIVEIGFGLAVLWNEIWEKKN
jgi:hypothetical protein